MNDEETNTSQNEQQFNSKKDELDSRLPPKRPGILNRFMNNLFGPNRTNGGFVSKMASVFLRKYKIVIICFAAFIIFIVAIFIAIGFDSSESAISYRVNSVSAMNITDASTEREKEAVKLFEEYDSLIGFTTEQLDKIYQELLDGENTKTRYLISTAQKEVGINSGISGNINDIRPLYEHIQRTEKYNFNNIKWTEYGHNIDKKDIETQRISELELDVPKEAIDDENTLFTLFELTAPYLLTNDIPLGLLCGLINNTSTNSVSEAGETEKFVYQVEKEAMTKMKVNKYDLQSRTAYTYYEDYDEVSYRQNITLELSENGNYVVTSVSEAPVSDVKNVVTDEKRRDGYEDTYSHDVYWYVEEAYTYDNIIKNKFNYEKYSDTDASNLSNPKNNTLTSMEEIDRVSSGTKYKVGDIYDEFGIDSNPQQLGQNNTNTLGQTRTVSTEYTRQTGVVYYYEKEWEDSITPQSSDVGVLSFENLVEYNTTNNEDYSYFVTDKEVISEDDFKSSSGMNNLYLSYTEEDKNTKLFGLSLIDFLNSNEGIYSKYLNNISERYAFNMGYNRTILKEGYTQIKTIINSLLEKIESENKVPFVYGSSLGYEVTTIGNGAMSGDYVSGMELLKQYIRYWEGSGKVPVSLNSEGVECYTVYDDGVGNLTVGYGINLTGNPKYKTRLEEIIGGTITEGTMVPVEEVDAIEDEFIKYYYDLAKSAANGLDLKEYQLHALASAAYNNVPITDISSMYNNPDYWNEETDDKYEEISEKYKDNETAVAQIQAEADYTRGLYTNYFSKYVHANGEVLSGLQRRRKSEYILFSLGYYDVLQKFYTAAGNGNLAGINLIGADGNIDEAAVIELQNFYEQVVFASGGPTANGSVNVGLGDTSKGNHGNALGYKSLSNFASEYQMYFELITTGGPIRVSEFFQCTWWAESMGYAFLYNNSEGKFTGPFGTSSLGNGGKVATSLSEQYGVNLTTGAQSMQPGYHYIISTGAGTDSEPGHVMYVEAVSETQFVISHAGSGTDWYGLAIIDKSHPTFSNCRCVCLEEILEKYI